MSNAVLIKDIGKKQDEVLSPVKLQELVPLPPPYDKLDEQPPWKELPAKAKLGISGCPLCCSEGFVRDFGAFGKKSGWTVSFGGHAGQKPRIGDVIAQDLSDEEVIELAKKCFDNYGSNANPKERAARFIERIGIDEFKKAVLA